VCHNSDGFEHFNVDLIDACCSMDKFFAAQIKKKTPEDVPASEQPTDRTTPAKRSPKGVILGKDGKPHVTLPNWQALSLFNTS